MKTALLWIRRELRLHDNEALIRAAAEASYLLPVYILPERELEKAAIGLPATSDYLELPFEKTGAHRRAYLSAALKAYQNELSGVGSDMLFAIGQPAEILKSLCGSTHITDVYTTELPGTEETTDLDAVEHFCDSAGIRLHVYDQHTLLHPDDLPFEIESMPDGFTPFRKKVEHLLKVRPPFKAPKSLPPLPELSKETLNSTIEIPGAETVQDTRSALPPDSSEQAALRHLKSYIWEAKHILTYKETRNGLIGRDYSSKLSGWLAVGSLSARYVYQEIKAFEQQVLANESTYWLFFELLWRDFFQFQMMKYEGLMFTYNGIRGVADNAHPPSADRKQTHFDRNKRQFDKKVVTQRGIPPQSLSAGKPGHQSRDTSDTNIFDSWCVGNTPSDFVNANMIELSRTGFMSNRGRQNVASYLTKTLGYDWRAGAAWFEHHLLDYDPASNWGNWAYVAGTGTDPRDRIFNVERQAEMYDADRSYRKLWL